jgi:hypothetical protein
MKPVGEKTQPGRRSFNLFYAKPEHLQPINNNPKPPLTSCYLGLFYWGLSAIVLNVGYSLINLQALRTKICISVSYLKARILMAFLETPKAF